MFASPGPIAISLGPIHLRWYGLLLGTAALLGFAVIAGGIGLLRARSLVAAR